MDLNQVTVPCIDYAASVAFYTRLGLTQIVDSPPDYARFETRAGTTLSIHKSDARANDGVVIYFEVPDLDATVRRLNERGFEFETAPEDQRWLWREAYLRDPANNRVCLFHAGKNRRFPPWRLDGETGDE
ncbi:MAG: VOC family protein [Pseudomonadota bacterium]